MPDILMFSVLDRELHQKDIRKWQASFDELIGDYMDVHGRRVIIGSEQSVFQSRAMASVNLAALGIAMANHFCQGAMQRGAGLDIGSIMDKAQRKAMRWLNRHQEEMNKEAKKFQS